MWKESQGLKRDRVCRSTCVGKQNTDGHNKKHKYGDQKIAIPSRSVMQYIKTLTVTQTVMDFLCYTSVWLTKWNHCEINERDHGLRVVSSFLHEPHSTYKKSASKSRSKYACVTLNTSRLEEVSLYNCYFVFNSGAVRRSWPVAMHFKKMRGGRGGVWHQTAIETRKVPLLRSYRCISEVRISNSHSLGQKVFLSAGKRLAVTSPSTYGRICNSRQATGSKNVESMSASRKEHNIILFCKASGQVLAHTRTYI